MNMKQKVRTTQFKVFVVMCISTIAVIFTLIVINNVVLETFYKISKVQIAKNVSRKIGEYYSQNMTYNLTTELRQIEIKNNIQILIQDGENIVYAGNKDIVETVSKIITSKAKIRSGNDNITIYTVDDSTTNKYMLLKSTAENGYLIYIKIPINPIKESVRISNETLILLGAMLVIISALASSYISRRLTDPIVQLCRITKKVANLDFSEKYKLMDASDDMNKLGTNVNEMSEKLEATIKKLRSNNNQLEKDVEEKSKIDEMRKQFISDVSHELKTPIGLIQGYAEGLIENVNEDEESRKFYAEVIADEANKMDKMVKELLELMKLEYKERQFKNTNFDLNELIKEEIRRETLILKEKNIELKYDDKNKIMVNADQEYIEQVVNNYMTNAIKHCQPINQKKKIVIRTEKTKNNKVRLYVYNSGEKISEDCIDKIWGRFYKIDSSRNRELGGTGIGLALVKAIMTNYGNEYGVKNLENGVEFYADINNFIN